MFCSKRDSHETIGRTNSREIYRAVVEKVYRDKTRDTGQNDRDVSFSPLPE